MDNDADDLEALGLTGQGRESRSAFSAWAWRYRQKHFVDAVPFLLKDRPIIGAIFGTRLPAFVGEGLASAELKLNAVQKHVLSELWFATFPQGKDRGR